MGKRKYLWRILISALLLAAIAVAVGYLHNKNFAVLNAQGIVAQEERRLIITTLLLSLIVVIPVFTLLFTILWRYRDSNKKAKYSPDLDGNRLAETVWWLIPTALIVVLAVITWRATHQLDPYRSLAAEKSINVQVVSLDWKWLFIYPEQGIASVNYLQIPVNTAVNMRVTSDAPMNSLWIPQLAGQVYSMPGMSTQLHIMANKPGDYRGSSANISGRGFSGMVFTTHADSQQAFDAFVAKSKQAPQNLDRSTYDQLAQPSEYVIPSQYANVDPGLYDTIIGKYMGSMGNDSMKMDSMSGMQGMGM